MVKQLLILLLTLLLHPLLVTSTIDKQTSTRKDERFLKRNFAKPSDTTLDSSFIGSSSIDTSSIDSLVIDDSWIKTAPVSTYPNAPYIIQEISGAVVIEAVARFDSCSEGVWQKIFDFGNGPGRDNVWLGQSASTSDMRFNIIQDGVEYSITAPNAINDGELAQWRAGIDSSGLMWIEKNDIRMAEGPGIVPSDVIRTSKLIGRSSSVSDSPLNGAILGISITNENSSIDLDLLNTVPRIRGPFTLRFFAQFDDLSGSKTSQHVFDFGNGPFVDNVCAGQLAGSKHFYFKIIRDGVSKRVVASNSIEAGVMTFWRVGVDTNGGMWIEKNGELVANGQGHVPQNVLRTKNFIGASNWATDSNLQGVVLGLRLDSS